ncbi:MAG: hypothetical protein ACP5NF_11300 [Thermoanaerobaculum sp.]
MVAAFLLARGGIAAPKSVVPSELEQSWFRLAATLEPLDLQALRDRTDELLQVAARLELARLSPYAQALVLRARTLRPQDQEAVLRAALRLDPRSPDALFALASWQLRRLDPAGVWTTVKAWAAYGADGRLVTFRRGALGILALSLLAALGFFWALVIGLQTLPRLWHDLMELASTWRLGANGWVFALFLVGLPLFLALDPVWLFFWAFALLWAYFSAGAKLLGATWLLFMAAAPTAFELSYRTLTHPLDPVTRAAWVLEEHRYDPLILVDLEEAVDVFGDDPEFFRLKGDVERQFGLLDASLVSYQEGLRIRPGDPALLAAAGTVHHLQGNFGAAVQFLSEARDRGFDPVIVNFNLSLALAHLYNFRDSDEAMAAARRASESRLRQLTRGRDNQVILPTVTRDEARAMLARKDPVLLLNRGFLPPPLPRSRTLFAPLTLAPAVAFLVALAHFLLRARTGFARACSKCGRTFCARCKLSRESQTYCTQCVNIFLKRDMVAPELQIAKQNQLKRRQWRRRFLRRTLDVVVPGLGQVFYGRRLLGAALVVPAAFLSVVASVWFPTYVRPLLLHVPGTAIQVLLGSLWLILLLAAQLQREVER